MNKGLKDYCDDLKAQKPAEHIDAIRKRLDAAVRKDMSRVDALIFYQADIAFLLERVKDLERMLEIAMRIAGLTKQDLEGDDEAK